MAYKYFYKKILTVTLSPLMLLVLVMGCALALLFSLQGRFENTINDLGRFYNTFENSIYESEFSNSHADIQIDELERILISIDEVEGVIKAREFEKKYLTFKELQAKRRELDSLLIQLDSKRVAFLLSNKGVLITDKGNTIALTNFYGHSFEKDWGLGYLDRVKLFKGSQFLKDYRGLVRERELLNIKLYNVRSSIKETVFGMRESFTEIKEVTKLRNQKIYWSFVVLMLTATMISFVVAFISLNYLNRNLDASVRALVLFVKELSIGHYWHKMNVKHFRGFELLNDELELLKAKMKEKDSLAEKRIDKLSEELSSLEKTKGSKDLSQEVKQTFSELFIQSLSDVEKRNVDFVHKLQYDRSEELSVGLLNLSLAYEKINLNSKSKVLLSVSDSFDSSYKNLGNLNFLVVFAIACILKSAEGKQLISFKVWPDMNDFKSNKRIWFSSSFKLAAARKFVEDFRVEIKDDELDEEKKYWNEFRALLAQRGGDSFVSMSEGEVSLRFFVEAVENEIPSQNSFDSLEDKRPKVLVVEDHPNNQKLIRKMMNKIGCSVTVVSRAEDVEALLKERKYDLLFMDLHLPGISGIDASYWIRDDLKCDIPIIALTADVDEAVKATCFKAGMVDFLTKPYKVELINACLKKWTYINN